MNQYIGRTLGGYQVLEQVGQGGMATIFKAYQPSMDRYVAIKVLPSHFTEDETFVARFTQEARTLARLEHPHILPVYDYGEQEGTTYLVMRYVSAGTLKDLIAREGPLPLETTARLIRQIGSALSYAHSQGVIHRDIKPTNVLIQGGNAFLTDFGIAKLVAGTAQFTATGAVVGTPAYMAPEQGLGETVDHRSDIYALGVVLYEMAVGRVPYEAETPLAVLLKHVNDPLPPPRLIKPDLPEAVERVILKAMAKSPDDRFQSADAMVEALENALSAAPTEIPTPEPAFAPPAGPSAPTVPPAPPPTPSAPGVAVPPRRRIPWGLVLAGVGFMAVLAVAAVFLLISLTRDKETGPKIASKPTSTSRPAATTAPTFTPLPAPTSAPEPTPTTPPLPTPTPFVPPTQPPVEPAMKHFEGSAFAIDYPQQWEESKMDAFGMTIAVFTTRQLTLDEIQTMDFEQLAAEDPVAIVMVVPPDMTGDMGLDDLDAALAEFDDIVPSGDATIIQQGDTTLGGAPAKIIVAKGSEAGIGEMGVHLVLSRRDDGTVMLMMGVSPAQDIDANLDLFQAMQDSFQVQAAALPTPVGFVPPVPMDTFVGSTFSVEYPTQWEESIIDALGLTIAIFSTQQYDMADLETLDFNELAAQDPIVIIMVVPPDMVSDMGLEDVETALNEFDDIIPEGDATVIQQGDTTLGGVPAKLVIAKGPDPDMGEVGIHLALTKLDDGTVVLFMGVSPATDLDLNLQIFEYMHATFDLF